MISNFLYALGYLININDILKSSHLIWQITTWKKREHNFLEKFFKIVKLKRARFDLVKNSILYNCFKFNHHLLILNNIINLYINTFKEN